jgi:pseudaminic acid cytidylyltransferase
MNICVIPARGGSKRIPRKNIKFFFGKPMIAYPIEAAIQSQLFDRVLVSTDDTEIAAIAQSYGADVIERPSNLADDFTPTVPVIAHAIAWASAKHDVTDVCCIYPCTPFLQSEDLIQAKQLLDSVQQPYVFPVVHFPSPPQLALKRSSDGSLSPLFLQSDTVRTQDLEAAYHDAGQFYWGHSAAWLSGLNIHRTGYGMLFASHRSVDVDTLEDWQQAEYLYQVMKLVKES